MLGRTVSRFPRGGNQPSHEATRGKRAKTRINSFLLSPPPPPLWFIDPAAHSASEASQVKGARPVFLQKPAIRQVGDKIVLECKLTADPKPVVSWILNNQPISFGPGSRLTSKLWSEGSTHTLTLEIAQVSVSDAGEYKAYAKNDLGEATATITLNFEGEGREIARR